MVLRMMIAMMMKLQAAWEWYMYEHNVGKHANLRRSKW